MWPILQHYWALERLKCYLRISNCQGFWFEGKCCVLWVMDSRISAVVGDVLWRGLSQCCMTMSLSLFGRHTLSSVCISWVFSLRFSTRGGLGILKLHFIKLMHRGMYLQDFLHPMLFFSQRRPLCKEEANKNFGPKSGLCEPSKMLSANSESLNLLMGFGAEQGINLRAINNLQIFYSSPQCFPHFSW